MHALPRSGRQRKVTVKTTQVPWRSGGGDGIPAAGASLLVLRHYLKRIQDAA
jgi:hypothetical protein